jgi:hypothetical protein
MSPVRPGGARQPTVRISPVTLPASAQVRLRRLAPGATYREDMAQLLLPITNGDSAPDTVRGVIEELIPPADSRPDGDTL